MKKVLITGAFGFLGRHTAKKMKEDGAYHITGIGHGKWNFHEYQQWGIDEWHNSTITFESLINLRNKFDVIIHCGGSGSVGFSIENPYEDFQKTVQSTLSILEYIRSQNYLCHFIYPSSPAVQGNIGDKAISENDPCNPVSPYGFHKKISEDLCSSYNKNFGIPVTIIRFFSIYGAGLQKQLLWDACLKIKEASEEVSFFGTGEETRDWINEKDATRLISTVALTKDNLSLSVLNCGSGQKTTVRETLELLVRTYDKKIIVHFNQRVKDGDPRFYHADITLANKLGWEPEISLKEGFETYVNFFKMLMT